MAWVTKLEGPRRGTRYRVQWRDPSGRHRSKTFRRRKDAAEFANRTELELSAGTWRDPGAARTLLRDQLRASLDGAVDLRPATRELYEGVARLHLVPALGDLPIGQVRPEDVREWMADLQGRGVGARTIQIARQVLSRCLGEAVADSKIPTNAVRSARAPQARRRELVIPRTADVEAIADAVAPAFRAMVLLAAYGGLRFGELAGLQRRDVRILERRVEVRRQAVETSSGVALAELKTRGSRRTVTIPASVAEELARRLQGVAPDPEAQVFTAAHGALLRRRNFRRRVWLPALAAAGVRGVRFHDLRHHAAAAAIAAGAHPKAIAWRLGHSSITVTMDTYGSLFPGLDEELAERLDGARALARPDGQVLELPTASG
ncbi:MAG: tyrosine-type recombinase/integrase [Candidatus Velamenicoccus archaeovorus]